MKNVSTLKSNNIDSPKTPGGISKSLLTPCRRLGLSRKWGRAGPSPFVSPISGGSSNQVKTEKREMRKRKVPVNDEEIEIIDQKIEINEMPGEDDSTIGVKSDFSEPAMNKSDKIVRTQSRHVEMPRTKKSKTLLLAVDSCKDKDIETSAQKEILNENLQIENPNKNNKTQVKTKTKQLCKTTPVKSNQTAIVDTIKDTTTKGKDVEENSNDKTLELPDKNKNDSGKSRSPNDLTKECMVVIQKKIFKIDKRKIDTNKMEKQKDNSTKDNLDKFDSDSDELPLKHLARKENIKVDPQVVTIDDDDFIETPNVRVKKLEDKNTSTSGLKTKRASKKERIVKTLPVPEVFIKANLPSSQSSNSFDDDEDFDLDSKRTILIRKSYDKVSKPLKMKSTGSITQRDIDELRARIETKKRLLLAKAMSTDTEELRGLIKKWQKGCQHALVELMELMKTKFPDRQNMDYSEILQSLNIPTALVGYDSDNDCFNTPDDASTILSKFNDL